jgi:hypothetical protein
MALHSECICSCFLHSISQSWLIPIETVATALRCVELCAAKVTNDSQMAMVSAIFEHTR